MYETSWQLRALKLGGYHIPAQSESRGSLLALHGWLDNAGSFLPLAQEMPDFDWFLVDLPGHGHSEWLPSGLIYHFIDWVAFVCELIGSHLKQPVGLLAHSMGAGIAPLAAVGAPQSISKLILIDGLGPVTSTPQEAPDILRQAIAIMMKESKPRPYPTRVELAQAIASSRSLSLEQAEPLVQRAVRETAEGWVLRHDPRLKWPSRLRMSEDQVRAFLREINQPTMVIVPEQGLFPKYPAWAQRQEHLPNRRSENVAGGHHVHLENPMAVARLVRDFF